MTPVQQSRAREAYLISTLRMIAERKGVPLAITPINSLGELDIHVMSNKAGSCGSLGVYMASLFSQVKTRCGHKAYIREILPCNGWLKINHFELELMLMIHDRRLGRRRWAQPHILKMQYLDWMNNYLTVEGWHNIHKGTFGRCRRTIKAGRYYQYGYATIQHEYNTIAL